MASLSSYATVFDAMPQTYVWEPFLVPAFGCLIGTLMLAAYFTSTPEARRAAKMLQTLVIGVIVAAGCGFATMYGLGSGHDQYQHVHQAAAAGTLRIAEGPVTNLVREGGRQVTESFDVDGQHFAYDKFSPSSGFHTTDRLNDPIRAGRSVRLSYVKYAGSNIVVRIEIAR